MTKAYTAAEVFSHNSADSTWLVIEGKVYDVTKYLDSHPGGFDTIVEHAGTEATAPFDDVSHSASAKKLLSEHLIGTIAAEEVDTLKKMVAERKAAARAAKAAGKKTDAAAKTPKSHGGSYISFAVPVAIVLVALYYHFFVNPKVAKA